MLHLQHARGERGGGVLFVDGHGLLQDHGARVELVVHEVDRGAGELGAVGEDGAVHALAVHPGTAKGGQQAGVDVQDPVGVRLHDRARDLSEVPRQRDDIHLVPRENVQQGSGEGPFVRIAGGREGLDWDAARLRALDRADPAAVRHHDRLHRVQPVRVDGILDGAEVGAAAGGEHGEAHGARDGQRGHRGGSVREERVVRCASAPTRSRAVTPTGRGVFRAKWP